VPRARIEEGLGVLAAFVEAGLVASTSEARRQIKGGGLRVNDERVDDATAALTLGDLNEDGAIKLSLGRKKHMLIRPA
jgi:tyrosyl-tRNA synthetase